MSRRKIDNPVHLWNDHWVYICESDEKEKMHGKNATTLNLRANERVITREQTNEKGNKVNNETIYLMSIAATRKVLDDCGVTTRTTDFLPDKVVDARPRFAGKRGKRRNLFRLGRHYIDSGTPKPNPGGRRRVRATFAKQPKDPIARSNPMRREIINQALMYTIVSLFVFMMMPLLRFVS